MEDHDAVCEYCAAVFLCPEAVCEHPPMHSSICTECLAKERQRSAHYADEQVDPDFWDRLGNQD